MISKLPCTITHPKTDLWLNNLQIPHLNSTRRKVRNFKLDINRPLSFTSAHTTHTASKPTHHAAALFVVAAYRRQPEFSAHEEFLAAAELLDFPDDGRGFGRVVDGADVCAEARRVGVFGDGNGDLHVVGCGAALELCSCLDIVSNRVVKW
jgi:hypothetical protein